MKLLDLFCGAGGAGEGYRRAGFYVVGVDITPHPDNPSPVIVADALDVLADAATLAQFDAIHASPPCQSHTTMSAKHRNKAARKFSQPSLLWGADNPHADLIAPVLGLLSAWGGAWVVENVPGARPHMPAGSIVLSGGMFGLRVERPRLFGSSAPLTAPPYRAAIDPIGVYGRAHDGRLLWTRKDGTGQRAARSLDEGRAAMGIDWMAWADLTEAIPPAYTEHIGRQLAEHLAVNA